MNIVEKLEFKNITMNTEKIKLIVEAIQSGKKLKTIVMHKCKLRTEYHIQLYNAIKTSKTIFELKLHHVHLLPKATTSLSELLISNHNITRLMVRDCGIDDREMDDLSKGIKSHKLEHLDLRNNIFEDHGLKTLI